MLVLSPLPLSLKLWLAIFFKPSLPAISHQSSLPSRLAVVSDESSRTAA